MGFLYIGFHILVLSDLIVNFCIARLTVVLFGLYYLRERLRDMMDNSPTDKGKSNQLAIVRDGWRIFRSEQELKDIVLEYFSWEEQRQRVPQMLGIAVYIGCHSDTLREYAKGTYDNELNRYSDILKIAADRIVYEKASGAYDGRYNANFAKFDLTVNHDWIDKNKIDVTSNGQTLGSAELQPKAIDPALSAEDALRSYQEFQKRVKDMVPVEVSKD